jgi:hypothetical protein
LQDHLDVKKSKVIATVAHPGISASSLQASTVKSDSGRLHNMMLSMLMRWSQSEEDGAMPLLQCACAKDVAPRAFYGPGEKGLPGMFMGDTMTGKPKALKPEKVCTNEDSKKMLWELSEKAVGPFFT